MLQYCEAKDEPEYRHVVRHVSNGKTKRGKQVLTTCGSSLAMDDVVVFAQPSSQVGDRAPAPPCPGCNGADEPAAEPVPLRLEQIAVADIDRSPLNHRTQFDGIAELGADIKANGLRVPIKVRPMPAGSKSKKTWELVYGERRWRAAKASQVEKLPALIAELDDLAVIKEQLVENVSRMDVHPLEEADGYQALMEQHGYSAERIAKETGKSRTAIYNRLKLRELPAAARDACFAGKLSVSVAELIARIPVEKLREEATRDIIRGREQDRWELDQTLDEIADQVSEDLPEDEAQDYTSRISNREGIPIESELVPLSTREASALIKRRYMLRLELAPFDTSDAQLTTAGACTKCVHRTGNQPDLFGDVASADVCTNPPCFEGKRVASTEKKIAESKAAGRDVMPAKDAEKIFGYDGALKPAAPFVDLDAEASWEFQELETKEDEDGEYRERTEKTWRQVLGDTAPPPTIAMDEKGKAHELVDRKTALASLDRAGKLPKEAKRVAQGETSSKSREKAEREKHEIKRDTAAEAIGEMVDSGKGLDSIDRLRWLAECVIRQASMEAHALVVARRALLLKGESYGRAKNENGLLKLARDAKRDIELEGLVIELLASENAAARYHTGYGTNLTAAAKVFKVDLAKVKKRVETRRKEDRKPAKKAPAKKKGRKS